MQIDQKTNNSSSQISHKIMAGKTQETTWLDYQNRERLC